MIKNIFREKKLEKNIFFEIFCICFYIFVSILSYFF